MTKKNIEPVGFKEYARLDEAITLFLNKLGRSAPASVIAFFLSARQVDVADTLRSMLKFGQVQTCKSGGVNYWKLGGKPVSIQLPLGKGRPEVNLNPTWSRVKKDEDQL